jgi:hypothetical protein
MRQNIFIFVTINMPEKADCESFSACAKPWMHILKFSTQPVKNCLTGEA